MMVKFTGLLFALALSKQLLFQVRGQDRCSSSGISDREYSVFMGACDAHRKPKDSLDITKHAPLAFLCEGRTHGGSQ